MEPPARLERASPHYKCGVLPLNDRGEGGRGADTRGCHKEGTLYTAPRVDLVRPQGIEPRWSVCDTDA